MNKFKVGDVVVCDASHAKGVVRVITEVRASGYSWQYPDMPDKGPWWSENGSDPFFELGWRLLDETV